MQPFKEGNLGEQWRSRLRGRIDDAFTLMATSKGLRRAHIRVKQARSMLALGCENPHQRKIERFDRKLHDVAEPMSIARDAEALIASAKTNRAPVKLAAQLERESARAEKRVQRKRACLRKKLKRLATCELPQLRDEDIRDAIAKTEGDARAAMRTVQKRPLGKSFHELRKRCKDLRCQYELLSIAFAECAAKAKAAQDIGDRLGDAHDLRALVRRLSRHHDSELRLVLKRKLTQLEAAALLKCQSLLMKNGARKSSVRRA